jgi:hypothetical protein
MHQRDQCQHDEPPGEPAGEADALLRGIAQLNREAESEQEGKDGVELAEGEQVFELRHRPIERGEQHEVRDGLLARQKPRDRVRDDDAKQGIGAEHIDDREALAREGGHDCSVHGVRV